jgi:hypothetical protein
MSVIYKQNLKDGDSEIKLLTHEELTGVGEERELGTNIRIEHQRELLHLEQIQTLGTHCISY